MMIRISALLYVLLLAACSEKNHSTDYYPLKKGFQWQYEKTQEIGKERIIEFFNIENRGKVYLSGTYADEATYVRRTSDGTDYYILQEDTGSYRVGKRTVVELKPRLDQEERKILPSYIDIAIGSNWHVETHPYVLRVKAGNTLPDPRNKKTNMLYEVVALDETIEVQAGRFENCVVVEGNATIYIYADSKLGLVEVPITQKEWYAPGIGLVKMVRDEPLNSDVYEGGRVTLNLIHYKH